MTYTQERTTYYYNKHFTESTFPKHESHLQEHLEVYTPIIVDMRASSKPGVWGHPL